MLGVNVIISGMHRYIDAVIWFLIRQILIWFRNSSTDSPTYSPDPIQFRKNGFQVVALFFFETIEFKYLQKYTIYSHCEYLLVYRQSKFIIEWTTIAFWWFWGIKQLITRYQLIEPNAFFNHCFAWLHEVEKNINCVT